MIITDDRRPAAFRIISSKRKPDSRYLFSFTRYAALVLRWCTEIKKTERFPAALHFNCNLTYKRCVLEFESYVSVLGMDFFYYV